MTIQKKREKKKEFPGYPHYPAKEDIMNSKENERVDMDVENLSRANNVSSSALPDKSVTHSAAVDKIPLTDVDADDIDSAGPTDADLTSDDLIALGTETESGYGKPDDLDIPGSEEDDADEEIGEEDEENNYYSIGGDAHENLEEDKGS